MHVADSLTAAPRLLLDPNKLSADGTVALKGYAISDDGKFIAYGLSSGGSDWEDWHVLDVAGGKNTDDELHWVKFSGASWRRDGTGFYYSRYDEPKGENALKAVSKFQKLYFHRLGTKQLDDELIHEQKRISRTGCSARRSATTAVTSSSASRAAPSRRTSCCSATLQRSMLTRRPKRCWGSGMQVISFSATRRKSSTF